MNWTRILPPSDEGGVVAWRWTIAVVVLVLLLNGLSGRGWVLPFGDYAYAEEVAAQGEKLDRMLTLTIAGLLRNLRKDECAANGNGDALKRAIDDYQEQYRELTGARYPLPPCEGEHS